MSGKLTGAALAAVLVKAAEPAIAEAVRDSADLLVAAVDEGHDPPSPPLWGRAGEGGEPPAPSVERRSFPAIPLPAAPPQGGRAADRLRRTTGRKGGASVTLTLAGANLFAREFGALGVAADPVLAPAIDAMRRRPA